MDDVAGTSGDAISMSLGAFRALALERVREFPYTAVADAPGLRRAAVVLCTVADPAGRPAVIVIRRAYQGRNAGQWGLPGGRQDPGETPVQTGLRELAEELGITVSEDDVLGRLDDFPAASGFAITPIVVVPSGPVTVRPNAEIHSVHYVELSRVAAPDVPHWVSRTDARRQPDLDEVIATDAGVPIDATTGFLQMRFTAEMTIHAPTGAMLWQFREVVLLGRPAEQVRVAHFWQPEWTRR
jgi:8-oxo-dGTP pyrophosphatase MutT (NUDIX family)